MIYPSFEEFNKLAEDGKRIPVCKIIPFEGDFFDLASKAGISDSGILFESLKGSAKISRYSIFAVAPFLTIESKDGVVKLTKNGISKEFNGSPIDEIRKVLAEYRTISLPKIPSFCGGAVGYFSYDAGRWFEKIPDETVDDTKMPDCQFHFFEVAFVFDHFNKTLFVTTTTPVDGNLKLDYFEAVKKVEESFAKLEKKRVQKSFIRVGKVSPNLTQKQFEAIVKRTREYIFAGDIFQANLSLRLDTPFVGDSFELYKILRRVNPSPFAAYLNFKDIDIVSSSPERLVKIEDGVVETRPIAGTRRRGINCLEDEKLSVELILNQKERAEHVMLVDLERNDLGRICDYGSVCVDELMVIEQYSHVIHIVSNVKGKILPDKDLLDVMRACFPGGTITGCPKIRAMEIIDELEPTRRGIYTGSIGYLSFSGHMDLNIAIRTIVIKDNVAYAQAGAGVVADSEPKKEYFESLQKAKALLKALEEYRK
ncbi:aminodeoxychorismate synthase component I [Candidatus Oleimmundimicrobium sp.]|uniref:aminodeoxychorismate synthase component I n=1 Tax=Candidatus Oleimmundimicrobium sp. TaxID=3060597 RepID=UPI00272831CD|nr:aminodeoxychorismate synthase component I [Candidatus Oleimmundimicrobium sp.]MDO8885490.1 aminodeoxychorismate synthase component I [Candidatus Oleimmundimicrobium sp.]